jgi:hypothetical protein
MLRAFCLTMTMLLLPSGYASADAPPDLGDNAALKYWQAFAQLPKFTDAQSHKLNAEFLTMPVDAHAWEIVAKADYALRMMHRAAKLPHCDWGLAYDEGIELLLPHAQASRTLATLACLRARIRFEDGHFAEGIEDIIDAMTVGRHVSMDGSLITLLLDYGIEYRADETLALYLPKLSSEAIKSLKTRLASLPPGESPTEGMVFEEKAGLDWLIRKVKEQKDKEGLVTFVNSFFGKQGDSPEQNSESGRAFVEKCGGTVEGVIKMAEETRPYYRLAAKLMELPPDQFQKQFELETKTLTGNPVFKTFFPAVTHLRRSVALADVRRALFVTALDVQLNGPEALKKHTDPVVGGPFELVPFEGGFELHSKFKVINDKPWVLVVGQRSK